MDTTLKQRILGIIVLVALLGICLSVLLHHNKNPQHSKMPTISKTTTPPIVNTTSSLLNSTNSANMTPANTNVFDNDIPPPVNTQPSSALTSSQTPTVQAQTQTPTQTPAQPQTPSSSFNETSPQSPSQPVINNGVSPTTVASSTIKPITPPPSTSSQSDIAAQITATTPNTSSTITNSATANTNDNSYSLASDDDSNTPAIAAPKSNPSAPVVHKAKPHTAVVKSAVVHKKSTPIHHASVVNTTATDTAINSDQTKNYVVQVGSFNLQANAETLADKLRAKGFDTIIQKSHTAQGEMTRVVVGKNGLDHAQVETLRNQLQSEMQIQGFITPQNISNTSASNATHSNTVPSNKTASKSTNPSSSNTSANDDI